VLRELEVGEDVGLEGAADEFDGDLRHRSAFGVAGVVDERVEVPRRRRLDVAGVEDVKLLDGETVLQAEVGRLAAQLGDLRPDLGRRDDVVAGLREAQRGATAEARARARDQDLLHRSSFPIAARATSPSWSGSPPETPIAPINAPPSSCSATPPASGRRW
jgi:hypothetical protein